METFLESRLLGDIPYPLVKQLSKFIQQHQIEKSPFSRGSAFVDEALQKHTEWLALQDIPETIPRTATITAGNGGTTDRNMPFRVDMKTVMAEAAATQSAHYQHFPILLGRLL
jgi:hypothetical protein